MKNDFLKNIFVPLIYRVPPDKYSAYIYASFVCLKTEELLAGVKEARQN